jgi:hypothetical protein
MNIWCRRVAVTCSVLALLQGCAAPPKRALDLDARSVSGGRQAVVVHEAAELQAEFVAANTGGGGGGALGAAVASMVGAAVNEHRADAAEKRVQGIRAALVDYDFDRRALESTQSTIAKIPWLDVKNVSFTKDGSPDKLAGTLTQSGAAQLLVTRYGYSMSPDGRQITVALDADIFPKEAPPGSSDTPRGTLFSERFRYISLLTTAVKRPDANAALWAADNGKLARAAVDAGLAVINDLLVRSLSLTPEAAAALDHGPETTAGGHKGNLVETSATGTLLYVGPSGAWIFVDRRPGPTT